MFYTTKLNKLFNFVLIFQHIVVDPGHSVCYVYELFWKSYGTRRHNININQHNFK